MIKAAFHNLKHKLRFWTIQNAKVILIKYGMPFFIILVVWEIIEDVLFPFIAYLLGSHLNPVFYTLIPFAWLICLHPIAVPILWTTWLWFKKKRDRQ
jgi:hypothetical protein